jgi:plastocyanin domain-containing protein
MMDTTEIIVLLAGIALIAFVLWYFFAGEGVRATASATAAGAQHLRVLVKGGYTPDVIVVKRGAPVELDFYRDETSSCTEQVIFGDFRISRMLPAFKTTRIVFTPERAGAFTFNCGMNMVRGKLIVEE